MADSLPADRPEPEPLSSSVLANFRFDVVAGFLVFLIAMPLCLAIARASGFPPIAGIWTAVIGGVMCTVLSNSELTIKGPAAGLIVIVYGAVTELGIHFGAELPEEERALLGYRLALGIGVVAGVTQVLLGICRAGKLTDFFPLTPVHGMLASIGIIIIAKQGYEVLGASAEKGEGPIMLLAHLPGAVPQMNPEIAAIGILSLLIMFGLPLLRNPWIKRVPAQLVVLVIAIALGLWFGLDQRHTYLFPGSFFDSDHPSVFEVGPRFLVEMPEVLKDPTSAFAFPDFRALTTVIGLKYLVLFSLIGSLESLLSAKAIELLDPWKRKTNFNRDLIGVGVANTLSAFIGGLPMISEIVRSSANINNGARTRWANFWHGVFLLVFVLLLPALIHEIPLAALGAMLVYTGFRLASPREFIRTYKIGVEQFIVFVGTIVATLATDLLIGILVGVAMEVAFHLWHGVPARRLFSSDIEVIPSGERTVILMVKNAAVFSNWLSVRTKIVSEAEGADEVIVDLADSCLIDHSVMEKLHELERSFKDQGKILTVRGLDDHEPFSSHPLAARKRRTPLQRAH